MKAMLLALLRALQRALRLDRKQIVVNIGGPDLSEAQVAELTTTLKRMIAERAENTVLTHYVARHWPESPGYNGRPGVVMSVCGKVWKPSDESVSEGECATCRAIVESLWMK